MSVPGELVPPGLWVPSSGRIWVRLPYQPERPSANPRWIADVLGPRVQIGQGPRGAWSVARGHADALLLALRERFPRGSITLIVDAAQQRKCGEACQKGNPENALKCQCQCGGENHGGISGAWALRERFAIETTKVRRVFRV